MLVSWGKNGGFNRKAEVLNFCDGRAAEVGPRLHDTAWAGFQIQPHARYLGYILGPAVSPAIAWRAPLAKWRQRMQEITAAKAPPLISLTFWDRHGICACEWD